MKRIFSLIMLLGVCTVLNSCSSDTMEQTETQVSLESTSGGTGAEDDTWAIYWYICGSDLESEDGSATDDMEEMMEVQLPENIQVVMQLGGAEEWQNDFMSPEYLGRYRYDSEGFEQLDTLPSANMGAQETLEDFLKFASDNYPADHVMVNFWNHGGGSVRGVCIDRLYDDDSLTLDEIYEAFSSVYETSESAPPIEVVGFDACLMASIDTAYTFSDIAKYMVASEDSEPGCGWDYEGWLSKLSEHPGMDGAELGKIICDTYIEACQEYKVDDEITLSTVDLGKTDPLFKAYDEIGKEALVTACKNPSFFASLGRSAKKAENYGGNTPEQGYCNMVDLYDLIDQSGDILPENANAVMQALKDCVVYKVNGPYREQSSGLSTYYPYDADSDECIKYFDISASDAFSYLYEYGVDGALNYDGITYIKDLGYADLQEIPELVGLDEDKEYPVYVDEEGNAVMELEPDIINILKGVCFELYYVKDDVMTRLGTDNDIDMDWKNGIFKDNFRDVWGSIDGHLCYLEIVYEGDDYNLYSVPILLNGVEYNLRVAFDYGKKEYSILGARKGLEDAGGVPDRNLIQLKPGDEITTIHYATKLFQEGGFEQVKVDTFTVTEDTAFYEKEMGDGIYVMYFELEDIRNSTAESQSIRFTIEGGKREIEID